MSHGPCPGGGGLEDADAEGDADAEADADADAEAEVDGLAEAEPLLATPVQVTPLRLNEAGAGLELLFQVPLNPKLVLPPAGIEPLYGAFVTLTFAPDWV